MDIDDGNDSDVDESALESELEAILSGNAPKVARPKKKGKTYNKYCMNFYFY